MDFSRENKKRLIGLARNAIETYVREGKIVEPTEEEMKIFNKRQGCFVTITKDGQLRGCIGIIEANTRLAKGVIENAVSAATKDPRFPPVNADELYDLNIEISILSVPEKMEYSNAEELQSRLESEKPGVIISKGLRQATFLPQVWKQLPDAKIFLSELCLKAGLHGLEWKTSTLEMKTYTADVIEEDQTILPSNSS